MVPHLTTALTGPLLELESKFLESSTQIEHWLRGQWLEHTPPFYSSCDLRNSGFKLAPVDTNLYPGGFNNLNPAFLPLCVQAAMSAIEKICPEARNLLLRMGAKPWLRYSALFTPRPVTPSARCSAACLIAHSRGSTGYPGRRFGCTDANSA